MGMQCTIDIYLFIIYLFIIIVLLYIYYTLCSAGLRACAKACGGLSVGGGCALVCSALLDADYRLCVFARIKTGGVYFGKIFFSDE